MPEEVSPESKLYVKEEIEKVRKEFKEGLKDAQSKATKIFSTVAMIIGLVTGVSVYLSINNAIQEELKGKGIDELKSKAEGYVGDASNYVEQVKGLASDANIYATDANTYVERAEDHLEDILRLKKIANLPIGTIVASMLAPDKFTAAVGNLDRGTIEWVLADGRGVKDSQYSRLFGELITPDLRGMFLRGMNVDGGQDPQQGREAGDDQADSFKTHLHYIPVDDNPGEIWGFKYGGKGGFGPTHIRETSRDGEVETRPKNIAVYFYIKIN